MKIKHRSTIPLLGCLAGASIPLTIFAFSTGPVVKRTGAPVDGGLDCTACHRTYAPANSDPRGKFTIQAAPYTPGVKQTIKVHIEHPEATRWGFQLTGRMMSDETKMAGTFTPSSDVRVRCDTDPAADAPCNGALEFAEHTAPSTHPGTTGGHEWEIEWTPPATDVGEIVFYAAGNAANNSGTPAGDRIYTARVRIPSASGGCFPTGTPTISAVVNAANSQAALSMNELITIYGSGFTTRGFQRTTDRLDMVNDRYPKELGCVAVEVAGEKVPILYISDTQINAQAPTRNMSGPVSVAVTVNPGRPNQARVEKTGVQMMFRAPALFTFAGTSSIAAQHANFDTLADPAVIPSGKPAQPGEVVTLYGTGFGITEPVYQAGERAGNARVSGADVSVTVGAVTLRPEEVTYAGLSPGSITGLYQLNIRIPDATADGNIPVVIRMAGAQTQENATIFVKRN